MSENWTFKKIMGLGLNFTYELEVCFRRTIVGYSLYIWPKLITQLYAGECPSNTVDCLAL